LSRKTRENDNYLPMLQIRPALFQELSQYPHMLGRTTAEPRHCNQLLFQVQQVPEVTPNKLLPAGKPELTKSEEKSSCFSDLKSEQSRKACAKQWMLRIWISKSVISSRG
jgi:hypothetical protein